MTAVDDRAWAGVDILLNDYARVRGEDYVVVLYTPESRDPAAWIITALKVRGVTVHALAMRPIEDTTLAGRLDKVLPAPESLRGKLVIITAERDTMSHIQVLRDTLSRYDPDRWLAARIISASTEFFTHAMNARTSELSARNTALLERFLTAREMRVTTAAGSDLRVELDPDRFRWLSNRGAYRPGGFIVLPAGEIATYPASVNGVLVADGAFNVNVRTNLDARLGSHPVRVRIADGDAIDVDCADPKVSELVGLCFGRPSANHVGEIGFGTNDKVREYISMNSHINERRPGVHIGFGQHNQPIYVVDYDCEIHLDLIAVGGTVWVDDDPEPIDLQDFAPSTGEHPIMVMDEDIDGDCCGLWMDDLRAQCQVPPSWTRREDSR